MPFRLCTSALIALLLSPLLAAPVMAEDDNYGAYDDPWERHEDNNLGAYEEPWGSREQPRLWDETPEQRDARIFHEAPAPKEDQFRTIKPSAGDSPALSDPWQQQKRKSISDSQRWQLEQR